MKCIEILKENLEEIVERLYSLSYLNYNLN